MFRFLLDNKRWLGAGFLLTFASAFGQTWFIALFAGFIKEAHGLTDGSWGALYTVATLASAALVFWRGSWADTVPFARLAPVLAVLFALAALGLAFSPTIWLLGLAVFGLRFCGQGMFSHIAMTAMGRWFAARRGRAVAIASLGYPTAEVIVPIVAVIAIGLLGWQTTWVVVAFVLALPIALVLWALLSESRTKQSKVLHRETPGLQGRHWQRADALKHWLLPALVPVLLTPGFIGTVVFFHQVHMSEVKGWPLLAMTPGYSFYAGFAVASNFVAGWASDRLGPHRLLPIFLVPMGIGISLIGPVESVVGWYVALAFLGISQGVSNALAGLLFPYIYGTRHLGSIRSMATTIMVISTAIGPGLTGLLIDRGIAFPEQGLAMGAWCFALSLFCIWIARRLHQEFTN